VGEIDGSRPRRGHHRRDPRPARSSRTNSMRPLGRTLWASRTKVLIQAVKRNPGPVFRLISCSSSPPPSGTVLRSQFCDLKGPAVAGRRYSPYAFTEQGVAMLLLGPRQRSRHRRQHPDHAGLCPYARDADHQQRARAENSISWRRGLRKSWPLTMRPSPRSSPRSAS